MARVKGKLRLKWLVVWLVQLVTMLLLGTLTALSLVLGKVIYNIVLWGMMPLMGFICACVATKKGLNNYLAWLAAPLSIVLGNLFVWSYPTEVAPVFVCAFVSLAGAATGEVIKRRNHR